MTTYISHFEGTEGDRLMLISGAVFSLGGIAGAIAAPIWGRQGQKHGFFKTLFISLFAAGVISIIQGLPDDLILFASMQFVLGLGFSGIFPSANSLLVLLTPPNRRGESFSLFFAAQQVGGAVGPVLGGVSATLFTPRLVFFTSGLIMLLAGLLVVTRGKKLLFSDLNQNNEGSQKSADEYIAKIKAQTAAELKQKAHNNNRN